MFAAAVLGAQAQNGRLVAMETGVNRNREKLNTVLSAQLFTYK